jgi:hypothetical protein
VFTHGIEKSDLRNASNLLDARPQWRMPALPPQFGPG